MSEGGRAAAFCRRLVAGLILPVLLVACVTATGQPEQTRPPEQITAEVDESRPEPPAPPPPALPETGLPHHVPEAESARRQVPPVSGLLRVPTPELPLGLVPAAAVPAGREPSADMPLRLPTVAWQPAPARIPAPPEAASARPPEVATGLALAEVAGLPGDGELPDRRDRGEAPAPATAPAPAPASAAVPDARSGPEMSSSELPPGLPDRSGSAGDLEHDSPPPSSSGPRRSSPEVPSGLPDRSGSAGDLEHDSPPPPSSGPRSGEAPSMQTGRSSGTAGAILELELADTGWIFLGDDGGLEFIGRERGDASMRFSFRLLEEGPPTTVARFERQDLARGTRLRHEEEILRISPDGGSEDAQLATQAGGAGADGNGPGAGQAGPAEAAPESLSSQLPAILESGEIPAALELADLREEADRLAASGEHAEALRLLELLLAAGAPAGDELLYQMAVILEAEWSGRDLERSRELYQRVLEEYPLSAHRREAAGRVEYIERTYFFIR